MSDFISIFGKPIQVPTPTKLMNYIIPMSKDMPVCIYVCFKGMDSFEDLGDEKFQDITPEILDSLCVAHVDLIDGVLYIFASDDVSIIATPMINKEEENPG